MDTVKKISRNIFFQGISEFTVKGLQILALAYLARYLKEAEFGKFSFAVAFTTIALIFIDLGLNPLFVREISRKKELAGKYLSHAIVIKSILSFVAFIVVIFIVNILGYQDDIRKIVYVMFASVILKSFTDNFSSIFQAFEEMQWDSLLKIMRAVILTGSVFFSLAKGYSLLAIVWMYVAAEVIVLASCIVILFTKFIKSMVKVQKDVIINLAFESLPFALTVLFYSIYFYIDSVMLSYMKGVYEVGIYSAAYNLTIALIFIPTIYITAIFPSLSKFYVNSMESLKFAYRKSLLYVSVGALPITIILFFLSEEIIPFLYGREFYNSALVLKIIAITIFFRFVTFINAITIISIDKQKQRLYSQAITAILNIILNLILIPAYGFIGAAIATVITEFFLFVAYFHVVIKDFGTIGEFIILIKPAIALVISSIFFLIHLNLILKIAAMILSYSILLILLRTFKKEDWYIFKKILNSFYPKNAVTPV